MSVIGIDPGKNGGIALMNDAYVVVDVVKMPQTNVDLRDTIEDMKAQGATVCYLEKVHAMPNNGAVSMFTFGQQFGWLQQVLADARIMTIEIPPNTWQKALGVAGTGKDKAEHKSLLKSKAQQLFPSTKVTNYNQDALLIAYYGLTKENNGK